MRTFLFRTLPLILAGLAMGAALVTSQPDDPRDRAKALIRGFATELQGELKAALAEGGPTHAIPVCSEVAPAIAARLSRESGALVRRVSLKVRNPQGLPDAWEQAVLRDFDRRLAEGEAAADLARAETVEEPTGRFLRVMKAIPTGPVCLACHGEQIDPAVEAVLAQRYPHDVARGYTLGQVRGAFSVKMPQP